MKLNLKLMKERLRLKVGSLICYCVYTYLFIGANVHEGHLFIWGEQVT